MTSAPPLEPPDQTGPSGESKPADSPIEIYRHSSAHLLAAAVTFPLSFGWIRFETARDDFPPNLESLRIQHVTLYFARADGIVGGLQ